MTQATLFEKIKAKQSYLCVGLDPDLKKIPQHLLRHKDPIFAFNKQIIDATLPYCVAYKPNLAFYEALGAKGWQSLAKTMRYIPKGIFTIADAKRNDIGHTAAYYAQAFFEHMHFDAITVSPYMGEDTVRPFLQYPNKWVILLALTSNASSQNFQTLPVNSKGKPLFAHVIQQSLRWKKANRLMFVVGATKADKLVEIRKIVPQHFLLVPGIGAQGGSLQKTAALGINKQCGLLVNASRSILYASHSKNFSTAAATAAQKIQQQMQATLVGL